MKAVTIALALCALASLAGCSKSAPDTKAASDQSASQKALMTYIPKCRLDLDSKSNKCPTQ
jgi:hypothetical protein